MDQTHDVVIVGGGPVGLTMALALCRSMRGISVAVLDRRHFTAPPDQRASSIAAGVRRVFEQLGVWAPMASEAEAVRALRITDSGSNEIARPLFLRFEGDVAPGEAFAHLVPNRRIAEVLLGALGGQVTFVSPVQVTGFSADAALGRIALADARVIAAPLIVAADGARSALRSMAGIETVGHDYKQAGLVTTIGHELDHHGVAYEHFRPAGPFASLPLPGRRSSLVWTETPAEAERLRRLPPVELAGAIEAAMGSCLGSVSVEDGVQVFPLQLQIAREFVRPRLALIGDAAHVVHPIAGQGLNLGLKDVASLAEVVIDAMRLGLDPGSEAVLGEYQRWRRFDTAAMALVTDGMNRLFANDVAPVRALRDLGLGLVDRLPPLKGAMISRAAGLAHRGPRLLQGNPI